MLFVLELLDSGLTNFSDLLIATLTTPKGQQGRIKFKAAQIRRQRERSQIEQLEKQRFYNLMYKLRKAGFIDMEKTSSICQLTEKGLEAIGRLKERMLRRKSYPKNFDNTVNIITFDVPEKLRKYRDWLRDALKVMGFNMLQRSVWIGKIKIPPEFLEDLNTNGLLDYIEIVAISKAGTIKSIE